MRILITPPSEAARSCRECLVAWSRAGLLDPFCWWEADPQSGADSLEVLLVDRGREENVLLADALRESRPEEVALVAFVPLDSNSSVDHTFSGAVDRKVDLARAVLPYQKGSPVACAIVVAPAAIGMPVAEGLFSAERSANVYVAPEDRDDPEGVNALAANEARLPPHASHAIATVTELWRSTGRNGHSVLDTLRERQPAIAPAPVQVVRCFTRGIDIGYLADHVAESVFLPGNAWPNPDPDRFDRVQDADALIDRAARNFMRKHRETLGPTEFDPVVLPPTDEVGLWEALKRLFRIIVDRIKRKPIEMIVNRVQKAHDWAAEKAEKIDGGATGLKIRRWARRDRGDNDYVDLDEALERPLFPPEGPVDVTWLDLRGLALCLVDGRAWPEGLGKGISERGRKRVLVTDPFSIGPDPELGYNHILGDRARPVCDPLNDDPSMEKKSAVIEKAQESGRSEPSAESESGLESGEAGQKGDLIPEAARGSEDGRSEADLDRVRASLLWRVGLAIAKAQRRVKSEAESLRAREEAEQDPGSDEAKAQEQERSEEIHERSKSRISGLIKTVVVSFIVVIIAALLALNLPLIARIPVLLALTILWLLVMAFKARNLLIEERREEQELLQQEVDKFNQKMLASLREGDAIRIARRYEEFKDWAEIIGWFVHSPWIGEPLERIDVDAPVPPGSRPLAFQMATGVSDHDWLSSIGRVSQSHVFQSGWLNDLYSENQSEVLAEGSEVSSGSFGDSAGYGGDPAADSSDDPDSPRRRLLRGVRRGDFRHIGDNAMTRDLLDRLDALKIDRAAHKVEEDLSSSGQPEPLPLSPSWFSPPSNLDSLMRRVAPSVLRVTASDGGLKSVGTGALLPGKETVVTALHVVEGAGGIKVSYPEGGEVEAVLEKAVPDYDLAVLRLSDPINRTTVELAESEGLGIGGPIVSLGYRGDGDSPPTLSWGIITDVSRMVDIGGLGEGIDMIEANYRSAKGSSGAPVFDLAGKVVGLHVGSRRSGPGQERLTYLSHAIPVETLQRLIAGDASGGSADGWAPSRSGLAAAESSGRRRAVKGMEPSAFFSELINASSEQAFLPGHWIVGSGIPPNEVEMVISEPEVVDVGDSLVSEYCEGNAFFRSLRLMVHRIDIAKPTSPETLASLVNGQARSHTGQDPSQGQPS